MEYYETTIEIEAAPEQIWPILSDVSNYPNWDSGVLAIEGRAEPGEKLKLTSEANPKRAFSIRVKEIRPNEGMRWEGGMPLGLFKGVRTYKLHPKNGGGTTFTMREEYTGPMLKMIWKSMPDLQPSFDKFARGLKARAEARA